MADKIIKIDGVEYIRRDSVQERPVTMQANGFCLPTDPATGELLVNQPLTEAQLAQKSKELAKAMADGTGGKMSEADMDALILNSTRCRPPGPAQVARGGFGNGN